MKTLKITQKMTVRDTALNNYLSDISRIEMLTPDEEVKLAQRIQQGDENALNKLVRGNLRFVVSVAKQYAGNNSNLIDLIQEGNIGLTIAAQKFDHTKGFKFISYAVWWIRQSIINYIASVEKDIRIPLNKSGVIQAYNKFVNTYEVTNGMTPDMATVAEHLKMDPEKLADIVSSSKATVSIDSKLSPDSDSGTLEEILPSENIDGGQEKLDRISCKKDIDRILNTLTERDKDCVKLYFGLTGEHPKTYAEIAEMYDLTRERVRQIIEKTVRSLRNSKKASILKKYI